MLIERWRHHYNTIRPHSSLGYRPPAPETILPNAPNSNLSAGPLFGGRPGRSGHSLPDRGPAIVEDAHFQEDGACLRTCQNHGSLINTIFHDHIIVAVLTTDGHKDCAVWDGASDERVCH